MKTLLLSVFVLLSSQVALAGEILVDGSSAASTKTSLIKMQKGFSEKKSLKFHIALRQIQLSDVKSATEAIELDLIRSLKFELLAPKLDGLNYKEILELAEKSPTQVTVSW